MKKTLFFNNFIFLFILGWVGVLFTLNKKLNLIGETLSRNISTEFRNNEALPRKYQINLEALLNAPSPYPDPHSKEVERKTSEDFVYTFQFDGGFNTWTLEFTDGYKYSSAAQRKNSIRQSSFIEDKAKTFSVHGEDSFLFRTFGVQSDSAYQMLLAHMLEHDLNL